MRQAYRAMEIAPFAEYLLGNRSQGGNECLT
jgi:hypothetical protein